MIQQQNIIYILPSQFAYATGVIFTLITLTKSDLTVVQSIQQLQRDLQKRWLLPCSEYLLTVAVVVVVVVVNCCYCSCRCCYCSCRYCCYCCCCCCFYCCTYTTSIQLTLYLLVLSLYHRNAAIPIKTIMHPTATTTGTEIAADCAAEDCPENIYFKMST